MTISMHADLTGFGVITTKGWVSYAVNSSWKVLSMQTKPPQTAALYQIPNPADETTPDSTNITIMTFETNSSDATSNFNKYVKNVLSPEKHTKYKEWDFYTQEGKQGDTDYFIRDAARTVPGAYVVVRLAWPRLKQNPKNYDSDMEATFRSVLDSVEGGIGQMPKKEGAVIRNPNNQ